MKGTANWLIAWRHNGENHWDAVPEDKFEGFLLKLLHEGVKPATIMISKCLMVNWLFPKYHKDCRQVWLNNIYDEINGTGQPSDYSEPNVEAKPISNKSFYGYISTDGRYFQCEYGGHSSLARQIVGSIQKIDDPQKYLEDNGWLVIYHDVLGKKQYTIGMARNKKMTDGQLRTLQALKLINQCECIDEWL